MDLKVLVILAFRVSIMATVFGFGLRTTLDDLSYLIRRPGLLARSLLAMFGIMPVVALVLARLFNFLPTVEIALICLSISPIPPLLPKKEMKAGGESAYALGMMAILSVLAIVVVPLALEILERVSGRPLSIAAGNVARIVLVTSLLPLAIGMVIRAYAPQLADSLEKVVGIVVRILLPLAVLALLVATIPAMWALVGNGTLIAMLMFLTIGLVVGHVLGGPNPEHALVLALSAACRHPAIALAIAAANFPEQRFGAAILLYLLLSVIAGMPYLAWQRRQMALPRPA